MKTVYKYQLRLTDEQEIRIPTLIENDVLVKLSDQVLKIETQRGIPCMWVLVDSDAEKLPRHVFTRGTGHSCDDRRRDEYLGTYQLDNGNLIFHVFGA